MPKNNDAVPEEQENKRFKDSQTEKRIYEHLNNKNDLISEDDISNVKTNIGEDAEETLPEAGEGEEHIDIKKDK